MPMFRNALECVKNPEAFRCTLRLAGVQTFCIEEMHKNFEITPVDEYTTRDEESGQLSLAEVERVWMECYENGVMPSATGVVWAKKSEMIKLPEMGF